MSFREEHIIKQLFKLNYEKQQHIKKLENKIQTNKYLTKYMRNDLRTLKSKYDTLHKYINKYEEVIDNMIKIFKCDKEVVDMIKNDCGILNDNFILVVKEMKK